MSNIIRYYSRFTQDLVNEKRCEVILSVYEIVYATIQSLTLIRPMRANIL